MSMKTERQKNFAAVRHLRDAQKEWAEMLDEEKLRQVIEENNRINATPEANSNNLTDSEIGTREIRSPLVRSILRQVIFYCQPSMAINLLSSTAGLASFFGIATFRMPSSNLALISCSVTSSPT